MFARRPGELGLSPNREEAAAADLPPGGAGVSVARVEGSV